jgi:hypothetical protein
MNERITVDLTPRTVEALDRLVDGTGLSKTDLVNRAVQLYAYIDGATESGAKVIVQWPSGDAEAVRFL